MKDLIKRYWDIFGGTLCGIGLSYLVHWQLNQIQLIPIVQQMSLRNQSDPIQKKRGVHQTMTNNLCLKS